MVLSSEEELSAGRRTKGPEPRASRENRGTLKWRQPYPRTLQRGWRDRAGQCSTAHPHPRCMELLFAVTTEVSDSQPQGDVTTTVISARGRAWASGGDVRSPAFLRWPLGKHGTELLPPGPVYRPAGPSLAVITAKCTDSTINKHTADSTGANITPNVYQLSPKL